jgi:deazaflavin-dependent oxidoreductase (nitroreductase family)
LTDRRRAVEGKDIPPVIEKPQGLFRLIVRYPVLYYRLGLSWLVSRQVLLLTTTGRKTGLKRLVPVDYEEEDGTYYIIPNQGTHATWYRNLVAHPDVTIEVGRRRMEAVATPVDDLKLKAHVLRRFASARWSFRAKKYYGIPPGATDEQLLELAPHRAVVAVRPRSS